MLPTALAAMKAGGCSTARMISAAPPAVGSAAISAPTNGPLRSTTTEAATTMLAVIAIFSSSATMNIIMSGPSQTDAALAQAKTRSLQATDVASASESPIAAPKGSAVKCSSAQAKAKPIRPSDGVGHHGRRRSCRRRGGAG